MEVFDRGFNGVDALVVCFVGVDDCVTELGDFCLSVLHHVCKVFHGGGVGCGFVRGLVGFALEVF